VTTTDKSFAFGEDGVVTPVLTHGDSRTVQRDALMERIVKHDETDGMPFYVVDLATVKRQHEQWTRLLPRVEPFYAIKCNNDQMVLDVLNSMGTGFDCASAGELKQVLAMGVSPDNIIYANPVSE
jgi:ornithine decarboxylase